MRKKNITGISLAGLLIGCTTHQTPKPNIVVIYLDDLGYGDISAYGATNISTPNIDNLANGGVRFTDAHASSATSTPSRYALLTGEYPWRNKDAKILPGTAPLLIGTEQMTLPKMLKSAGYETGIVGKWHLGLGEGIMDWNQKITPGPNKVGFNYSFVMAATQDRVPTVYIENERVLNLDPNDPIKVNYENNFEGEPTGKNNPEMLKMKWDHGHNNSIVNGIPRIGFMQGGQSAKWVDENMADTFLTRAQDYIKLNKHKPFFLYYAMHQPHVPRTPHPRFVGTTDMGPRGDVIMEADWCIGELMRTLQEEGVLENTLVIFSSDNGPVVNDGYCDESVARLGSHKPAGVLRGGKYSLFEAGTRVPFITFWKGVIQPGVSDALICQMDLMSSLAKLIGSDTKGPDSQQLLNSLLGKNDQGREALILEATSRTALRKGNWLMIPPYDQPAIETQVNIELGNSTKYQLYDLKNDIGQQKNLADSHPEILKEMISKFEKLRGDENENLNKLELK